MADSGQLWLAAQAQLKMSRIRPSKGLDDFISSGSLRTGDAYVYTAPPETPASRDKLIQPFSRQNTECVPWFASFCATQNDFPVVVPPPDSVRQGAYAFLVQNTAFCILATNLRCGSPPWRNAMDFSGLVFSMDSIPTSWKIVSQSHCRAYCDASCFHLTIAFVERSVHLNSGWV